MPFDFLKTGIENCECSWYSDDGKKAVTIIFLTTSIDNVREYGSANLELVEWNKSENKAVIVTPKILGKSKKATEDNLINALLWLKK